MALWGRKPQNPRRPKNDEPAQPRAGQEAVTPPPDQETAAHAAAADMMDKSQPQMTSKGGAHGSLSQEDLERRAVASKRLLMSFIAEAQSKENGFITPVSVALWASVSDEVDRRLSANPNERSSLPPMNGRAVTIRG